MVPQAQSFEFVSVTYTKQKRMIDNHYKTRLENGKTLSFTERIYLPDSIDSLFNSPKEPIFMSLLRDIHLILGISYWKMHCAPEMILSSVSLSQQQAQFWNILYTTGLGEFYYRNTLLPFPAVSFPYTSDKTALSQPFYSHDKALVGIGGGKDSLVSVELLRDISYPCNGFIVEHKKQSHQVGDLFKTLDMDPVAIQREIDPELLSREDVYKGHVPISAVYAFLGVLGSLMIDARYFVVSNEQSANNENVVHDGVRINHQWSKSEEFERLVRSYIHQYITPDITYTSLLRPLHEIGVIERFVRYPQYFHVFSSCNRNFTVAATKTSQELPSLQWCGSCPKCAFAFILLAAFLPRKTVLSIFSKNLLDDLSLITLFRQLLGREGLKPWDCVGTFEETHLAFLLAHERKEWEDTEIMKMFVSDVLPSVEDGEALKKQLLAVDMSAVQELPDRFQTIYLHE
jgi:hypothetical protein